MTNPSVEIRAALTAAYADKYLKRCGDCKLWMTKKCPREETKILALKPSCDSFQCDKFEVKS